MFLLCSIFFALKRQNNTRKHKRGSLQLRHSLFAQTWIRGQAFSALMSGYFVSPGSCNPRPSPPHQAPVSHLGFGQEVPTAFLFKLLKNNASTLPSTPQGYWPPRSSVTKWLPSQSTGRRRHWRSPPRPELEVTSEGKQEPQTAVQNTVTRKMQIKPVQNGRKAPGEEHLEVPTHQ